MKFPALLITSLAAGMLVACSQIVGMSDRDGVVGDPTQNTDNTSPGFNCTPKTCAELGKTCGDQADGCGGVVSCGTCADGACVSGACKADPKSCGELGADCGQVDTGAGTATDCGACPTAAESCADNKCGCVARDCSAQNAECGSVSDDCGNTFECGSCAGNANGPHCNDGRCTQDVCTPKTCAELGKNCGPVNDGCGKILQCGECASGTCGAQTPGVCGCTPKTCAQLGRSCGSADDGCGNTLQCGPCLDPLTCNSAGQCTCVPKKCPVGAQCGTINDGCGNSVLCGSGCPNTPNYSCVGNSCQCTPYTCVDLGCGNNQSNGCGGTINCGTCGGGGGGCFAAGTQVRMADGSTRAIEKVRAGELVMSFDVRGRAIVAKVRAPKVHGPETSAQGFVVLPNGLRVTPNHPIQILDADGRLHRRVAGNLQSGDTVLEEDRIAPQRVLQSSVTGVHARKLAAVEIVPGNGANTYDLELETGEGFIVNGLQALKKPLEPIEQIEKIQ